MVAFWLQQSSEGARGCLVDQQAWVRPSTWAARNNWGEEGRRSESKGGMDVDVSISMDALYATEPARPAVAPKAMGAGPMRPASAPWSTVVHWVPKCFSLGSRPPSQVVLSYFPQSIVNSEFFLSKPLTIYRYFASSAHIK